MNRLRRFWARWSAAFAGLLFKFEFEEAIDWSKTYIVCPNHTSNLDIAAMCLLVKGDYSFIGKEALKDGLVTRLFIKTVDIPVNRESNISAFRAFKEAGRRLQNGTTMVIFPEGKIGEECPPVLHPFKNGPFRLAIEQKIPIIPVSSANTWQMLWDDGVKYGTRPGICRFHIHKPVFTGELTLADADKLRDGVYGIIAQYLNSTPR